MEGKSLSRTVKTDRLPGSIALLTIGQYVANAYGDNTVADAWFQTVAGKEFKENGHAKLLNSFYSPDCPLKHGLVPWPTKVDLQNSDPKDQKKTKHCCDICLASWAEKLSWGQEGPILKDKDREAYEEDVKKDIGFWCKTCKFKVCKTCYFAGCKASGTLKSSMQDDSQQ